MNESDSAGGAASWVADLWRTTASTRNMLAIMRGCARLYPARSQLSPPQ